MEYLIPSDVDQPQTVDDFIVPLMPKNKTTGDLSLEKVQQKIVNIMGPLARVWKALEVATKMDKTVLILGQAFQQRLTTVGSMLSSQS